MSESSPNLAKVTNFCLLSVVVLVAGLKIGGLNKGFNITDEGYAVLGYEPLQERLEVINVFQILVYKIVGWLEPSLITYRAIAQILTVVTAVFFAFCFHYWFTHLSNNYNQIFSQKFIVLFFILGGFVLDYDRHNMLNYDVINNALNLVEAGLVLILISQPAKAIVERWQSQLGWVLTGFLISFQFLNKAPSAIAFIVVLVLFLIVYLARFFRRNTWYFLFLFSLIFCGISLGLVIYFIFFQDFWQYQSLLVQELSTNLENNYFLKNNNDLTTDSLLLNRFSILVILTSSYLTIFQLAKIYHYYYYLRPSENTKNIKLFFKLALIINLFILVLFLRQHLIQEINITVWYPFILFGLLLILVAWTRNLRFNAQNITFFQDYQLIAGTLFLFFLPFVAAIGTNTSIRALAARNIIPWLGIVVIFSTLLFQTKHFVKLIYFFTLFIIIWLGVKVSYTQIYHPYKLVENRLQQTKTVNFLQPHAQGLKVDLPTANFFQELQNLVKKTNFKPGDPIIALHDMPGLVYLLGGFSPGAPWYFNSYEQSPMRTCNSLLNSNFQLEQALFLVNSEIPPQVLDCLKSIGINFPDNYQKIGEIENPYYLVHTKYQTIHRNKISVWSIK